MSTYKKNEMAAKAVCFTNYTKNKAEKIPPTPRGNCDLLVTVGTFHHAGCSELPT